MAVDAAPEGVGVAAMAEYLLETPVVYAVLFGSVARGEADSGSTSTSHCSFRRS